MKKIFITCAAILALFSSCTSVLDKEDLSSISEDKVWVDKTLTTAFLHPKLGHGRGRCDRRSDGRRQLDTGNHHTGQYE